ncbi:MAG: peptidoglycan editing factor PgeF [Rhodobacteraceae bacterium]|nr:peptidoglycan editing factor PgeF [Paracoccaceae bacterium]
MGLNPVTLTHILSARHGFFTRHGGVSTGIFASLNCGYGSPENHELITQNRALIATDVGAAPERLYSVTQPHSADVLTINTPEDYAEGIKADAMVSKGENIALGVLTADCAPVLFQDAKAGVIGAAHAGWRGAFGGVLEATMEAMRALGATNINAVVGPCISQKNYEVGPEFLETFVDENPDYSRFFINAPKEKYLFDLPTFTLHRLRQAGVAEAEWTGHCTYAAPDTFYSYRYSQHNNLPSYGRMLSVITT